MPSKKRVEQNRMDSAAATERSGVKAAESEPRHRPGRRSVADRSQAVLALLAGKATVDQLAARFGVHASTIEKWRDDAIAGIESALRQGTAKPPEQLAVERELAMVKDAFRDLAIRHELVQRALKTRPSWPAKSSR